MMETSYQRPGGPERNHDECCAVRRRFADGADAYEPCYICGGWGPGDTGGYRTNNACSGGAGLAASAGESLRPLVCSAYRSSETQTRLYNNKIARLRAAGYSKEAAIREAGRWVAVPGTSEHQTGLAVDLVASSYQVLDRKQEQTAEQKWLMEHCWEYGFILRYPSDKSAVTGIGYEPWHYRYVGRETSKAIQDSGLCLEEYLTALENAEKNIHTNEN